MTFVQSVPAYFTRAFDFRGRACRSEFWYAVAFSTLSGFACGLVDGLTGRTVLVPLLYLVLAIPGLSLQVRRLHDTDRTGRWVLAPVGAYLLVIAVAIVPFLEFNGPVRSQGDVYLFLGSMILAGGLLALASITLLVWFCIAGTPGPNRFGVPRA